MSARAIEPIANLRKIVSNFSTQKDAAVALGVSQSYLSRHLAQEQVQDGLAVAGPEELTYPTLPSSELPVEKLIEQAAQRFTAKLAAKEARRWMEIGVHSNKPIGVCIMGDPHIDNPGCNWPLLREHIHILEETPGMYAIGGNDITDNWIGRLERLYNDSEVTKKQAWKMAKWLLQGTNIRWLAVVLGNHDMWGDGGLLAKAATQVIVPVDEWSARIQLRFDNGSVTKLHMSHDLPGTSQWNILHGPQKSALMGDPADLIMVAHKHQWALAQGEHPHTGKTYWLGRARGYKYLDTYADVLGFGSQRHGASITAVIDPGVAAGPQRIQCFADLQDAADYLTWRRSR